MLTANDPSSLANRAVCLLYLGGARACIDDCAAALKALEAEATRDNEDALEQGGQFAMPPLPEAEAAAAAARRSGAEGLVFELLRRGGNPSTNPNPNPDPNPDPDPNPNPTPTLTP